MVIAVAMVVLSFVQNSLLLITKIYFRFSSNYIKRENIFLFLHYEVCDRYISIEVFVIKGLRFKIILAS